jgi:predicted phage tail protein
MKEIKGFGGGGGKGGGGGGGRVAQEAPDTLRSIAYANVLDLVCEGEIEGLADGLKSVYFNETPLQNANGTFNFTGAELTTRNGTQAQSYIPGFESVENEIGVATEVVAATPIVRSITDDDADAVRVRVSVPQLTQQDTTTGDLNGSIVEFAIDLQSNGGGFVQQRLATINGKTTSKYERSYRIELTGSPPWDIRVRRITPDATTVALQNKTFFESFTEIVDGKFRYPNSAIVGVKIDSSQFNSIPRRSYEIKMLRVKVPSNYNPVTRVYTGIFDGTFNVAWTDNPAWCFYDLLTNERYGLGGFIPEAQVDKYTLYAIGQYCDQLVPNGQGGTEPRFTCNIYFQTRAEAFNVINNMASIFRGMPFWAAGSITLGIDSPSDPVYQFTNANVIDGVFNYSGSSLKARHTVALVSWNDPEDFYRQKVEYVEDAEGIERFGIVQTEIVAVGCASRGQANRVGRYILFTEQLETEMVTFKTGLEGYTIRPSEIIQVADEMRAGTRRGGRVVSASTTVVTLDANVAGFNGIVGGSLSIILPDGSLETRIILAAVTTEVTVSPAFSATPAVNTIWMLQTSAVSSQLFKIISAVEQEDGVEVTALAHNPGKYDLIEQNLKLQPRQISLLSAVPEPPANLQVSENLYELNADVFVEIDLSWTPSDGATSYQVSYKVGERNFVNLPITSATSIEIREAIEGVYVFKVFAISSIGKRSLPTEVTEEIYGKTLPPADVTNFSMNIIGTEAHFTWTSVPDLDLSHYKIRHSRLTSGATYAEAVDLILRIARPGVTAVAPAMTGTYFIKAIDKLGNASVNAAEVVAIIESIKGLNVVELITESPTFAGNKVECHIVDNTLVLDTAEDFDDVLGLFDDVEGDFDGGGGTVSTTGTYDFAQEVDLGAVFTSRVTAFLEVGRVDYVNTFDVAVGLFDDRQGQFDGAANAFDDTNVELQVAVTNDDPAGTPTYSAFRKFFVGDYKARGFRFRAVLTSTDAQASPSVSLLQVEVDMPDRVTSGDDIASTTAAGGKVVNFVPAFNAAPALGIAAQNLASGDFYEILSKSPSSFTIRFKNSGGSVVDRTFDFVAKGYGELAA